MKQKIAVAMSGGVDSSVVAALLQKQGYDVFGVTMQVWQDTQDLAIRDAQIVAKRLNISHHVVDLRKVFEQEIITYFTNEYLLGRTPNPCVTCNHHIKFGALLDWAKSMGADYLATGHYAKIVKEKDRYLLKKSKSSNKDQTYPLYHLTQQQLASIMFPLADYDKDEVRKIAQDFNLEVANKADSQDICFITNNNYAEFIEKRTGIKMRYGNFLDRQGNILGRHKGIYKYTIGQRKGLGIATGKPVFVSKINVVNNEIVLGEEEDILFKNLMVKNVNFIPVDQLIESTSVSVKIRYGAKEADAVIIPQDKNLFKIEFKTPQRAVTAGQSAVFYQGDVVLGGGIIQ